MQAFLMVFQDLNDSTTTNLELPKLFSAKCTFFEQYVTIEKNGFGDKKVNSLIKWPPNTPIRKSICLGRNFMIRSIASLSYSCLNKYNSIKPRL